MKLLRKKVAFLKAIAMFMAINLFFSIVSPTITYALTSGPGSPEFASFEPVATTDMVNVFSGDFTYNLPVLNVPGPGGGYALSLSYHSGVSSEEESSWVGFGWNINPGAINRNTRGIPDDYENVAIDYYGKTRPNWTATNTKYGALEIFSNSQGKRKTKLKSELGPALFSPRASTTIRYNNYNGFGRSVGVSTTFKGLGSLGMNHSSQGVTFSGSINPIAVYKSIKKGLKEKSAKTDAESNPAGDAMTNKEARKAVSDKIDNQKTLKVRVKPSLSIPLAGSSYGLLSSGGSFPAYSPSSYQGFSVNVQQATGITGNIFPIGIETGQMGSLSLSYAPVTTTKSANGYLHNKPKPNNDKHNIVSDYFVEKDGAYNKRDHHLGIPFSSPDFFALSGEGLSGSFRFHAPRVGHFYPSFSMSSMKIFNLGYEAMVGSAIDAGIDLGAGLQHTLVTDWVDGTADDEAQFNADDKPFARFKGDLAGELSYGDNKVYSSTVTKFPFELGGAEGRLSAVDPQDFLLNGKEDPDEATRAVGRGSFINPGFVELTNQKKRLTNFDVYNEAGIRYSYGERRYDEGQTTGATNLTRNETNLAFDVENAIIPDTKERGQGTCQMPYLIEKDINLHDTGNKYEVDYCDHKVVTGEIKPEPYANSFLLGEITTPQYVDVTDNGPTEDDYGAWTKFNYHQKYGSNSDAWYRWRMPYTGLLYEKNAISDVKDDIGTVNTGEKEVHYLKSIETKTHQAFFITNLTKPSWFGFDDDDSKVRVLMGSQTSRNDSRGAMALTGSGTDPASRHYKDITDPNDNFKKDLPELEYLEKIVLIPKARIEKLDHWGNYEDLVPVSTTHFDYDYSLVPNLPNNVHGNYPHPQRTIAPNTSGKLTLKKVWTEYEGVKNAKISPYQFEYAYKESTSWNQSVREEYPALEAFFNLDNQYDYYTEQNPGYSPNLLGPWGFNQPRAEDQLCKGRNGIYQGPLKEDEAYDPGAWHLKQIKLPSGGEILVEYEQKEYGYVQDQKAMTLASLTDIQDNEKSPSYTLNVEDLGLNPEDENFEQQLNQQIALITQYFEENKGYIFFKFLFALKGEYAAINDCKSEFITGYCKVKEVKKSTDEKSITITLDGEREDAKEGYLFTPKQGCKDYFLAKRMGEYDTGCASGFGNTYDPIMVTLQDNKECPGNDPPAQNLIDVIGKTGFVHQMMEKLGKESPQEGEYCVTISPESSYLKVPMLKAKRAGGPRVKRLISHDPGLESGDEALYGTEYHYIFKNGESSGVATTEPGAIREENALVNFLPRHHQSWLNRHIVGEDKEQSEGPLGESLLPGPSVGYARVVQSNIHKGITGAGFAVQEYYTCKDFPFDKVYNYSAENGEFDFAAKTDEKGITSTDLKSNTRKDFLPILTGVFNFTTNKAWAAQGFRFIQHDMHGKPKNMLTFGGTVGENGIANAQTSYLVNGETYEYFLPGEKMRMLDYTENREKKLVWANPGKEMDITMETKSVQDLSMDFQLEVDIAIGIMLPPPITVAAFPYLSLTDGAMSSHTTTKVIYYPCQAKAITRFQDGVSTKTENLAFDQQTGQPVLTASRDEYYNIPKGEQSFHSDQSIQFQLPAHWIYAAMGKKSDDPENTNTLKAYAGSMVTYGKASMILDEANNAWQWPDSVANATMQLYKTSEYFGNWFNDRITAEYNISDKSRKKLDKIWRPFETFIYRKEASNTMEDPQLKNYQEGLAVYDYFDHGGFNNLTNWIRQNRVTEYSPHGEALEEIYDFKDYKYNAIKYGYDHTQAIMVANNAEAKSIAFNDFETIIPSYGSVTFDAHSGENGLFISSFPSAPLTIIDNLEISAGLIGYGGSLKFWVNSAKSNYYNIYGGINGSPDIEAVSVARVGEWELMECTISPEHFMGQTGKFTVDLYLSGQKIILDDVRFQPNESQGTCYVYDPASLRLVAEFDDQHFGRYYQYNDEGQLTKKIIETVRGKRTVEETQYNLPVVKR